MIVLVEHVTEQIGALVRLVRAVRTTEGFLARVYPNVSHTVAARLESLVTHGTNVAPGLRHRRP